MRQNWIDATASACQGLRALVVGDLLLDRETCGSAGRLCPEAPVPVLRSFSDSESLGGAGNVARNLRGLGCDVTLLGFAGNDEAGTDVVRACYRDGIVPAIVPVNGYITPVKTRLYANDKMVMRVDCEDSPDHDIADGRANQQWRDAVITNIRRHKPQIVIVSDYAKGGMNKDRAEFLLSHLWRELFEDVVVLVDTKQRPDWYTKADVMTPNLEELQVLTGHPPDWEITAGRVIELADTWRQQYQVDTVAVTRGKDGAVLCMGGEDNYRHEGTGSNAYDVAGAGDTFVAALGATMATPTRPADCLAFAVEMATSACLSRGVTAIRAGWFNNGIWSKMAARQNALQVCQLWRWAGETIAFCNGCFDLLHPGHLKVLREANRRAQRVVVGLNSNRSVEELKGRRPVMDEDFRAEMLDALECVDLVTIFDSEPDLAELISGVEPSVIVRGNDHEGEGEIRLEPCEVVFVERFGGFGSGELRDWGNG